MKNSISTAWTVLGAIALLASGFLAILVTGAKMPAVKHMVDAEWIRWCLVVHVNLSTLVWFTALPTGLLHLSTRSRGGLSNQLSWIGFFLAVAGVGLMFSVPPGEGVHAILSNYIPVLSHQRYHLGLIVYLVGVVISLLSPKVYVRDPSVKPNWPGLDEIRFGLFIGGGFLVLAALCFPISFSQLASNQLLSEFRFFELGVWAGGHLIQHAAVVFLVCCWILFLSFQKQAALFSRSELFPIFAWLGLPLFFVPVLLSLEVTSEEYRQGFTLLMRWGIAPPVLLFLFFTVRKLNWRFSEFKRAETAAFLMSSLLLLMGFIFGVFIRGPDMRVPGHYHASIGAVTLVFMVMTHLALGGVSRRWISRTIWFYGVGQTIFAGGMFIAGAFGMPRKTYGSEHVLTHWGQSFGIGMMAIGGLVALTGGLFFALAILPRLRALFQFQVSNREEPLFKMKS